MTGLDASAPGTDALRRTVTPPGHAPAVWADRIAAAPRITPDDLAAHLAGHRTSWPTLLVVAAHPDDETIGLGRLASEWSRHAEVIGLLASAGEACVDHVMPRPAGLASRREAEWRTATARLGFGTLHTLRLPDGRLAAYEEALVAALDALLDPTSEPGSVVLAAPWRLDPHPDHQAVGRATARVARDLGLPLLEYPVWATYWARPSELDRHRQTLLVVRHDDEAETAYAEALAAFRTQLEPLDQTLTAVVPAEMLAHHDRQLVVLDPLEAR